MFWRFMTAISLFGLLTTVGLTCSAAADDNEVGGTRSLLQFGKRAGEYLQRRLGEDYSPTLASWGTMQQDDGLVYLLKIDAASIKLLRLELDGCCFYDQQVASVHLGVVALAMVLAVSGILAPPYRRYRRRVLGLCIECGYNLYGLPEPRCPECGTGFRPGLTDANPRD